MRGSRHSDAAGENGSHIRPCQNVAFNQMLEQRHSGHAIGHRDALSAYSRES